MEGFLSKRGERDDAIMAAEMLVLCFLSFIVFTVLDVVAGELVKSWRARYFVLKTGPSPVLMYYRAIEVIVCCWHLVLFKLAASPCHDKPILACRFFADW